MRGESPASDELFYTVLISFDGGGSYVNLLSGSDKTSIEPPSRVMETTDQAVLLVSVSDGVNTAFVYSDPFAISN